jgi:hypothetical protein
MVPNSEAWALDGLHPNVLPQPLLFIALAAHMSGEIARARVLRLVELYWVIRRDTERGTFDWQTTVEASERVGATRFLHLALTLLEQLMPGTVPGEALALSRARSTPIARFVVDGLRPATPILHEHSIPVAERVMWEPNLRAVLRRIARFALVPAGLPWRETVQIYLARLLRLLRGRVSWGPHPVVQRPASSR